MNDEELSLATRAAWLSYVGGYTQAQIADRLGVSRVKAHRLIAAAHDAGRVKVFVEGTPAECIALEDRLINRFGLTTCAVVPTLHEYDEGTAETLAALGSAGARFLLQFLEKSGPALIGVGHGRTLSSLADRLPHVSRPDVRFMSLLGSLTRKAAANPFDVIYRLAERTHAEGYFMPVPLIADTEADAEVLLAQRTVQQAMQLARESELCVVGIGDVGPHALFKQIGMLTPKEYEELAAHDAVGEVLGQFLDIQGRLVDCEINRRSLGLHLEDLPGRQVVAVAGGLEKVNAILATLRSGFLTGLIIDEATAFQAISRSESDANDERETVVERRGSGSKG